MLVRSSIAVLAAALATAAAGPPAAVAQDRPARAVDALVLARASNPVLADMRRQLGARWRLRPATERRLRHPRRYDVLIVDGDIVSPAELRRHTGTLRRFLEAGRAVLAFDMTAQHDRQALDRLAGITVGTGGPAHPTGVTLIYKDIVDGSARYSILDVPRLAPEGMRRVPRKDRRRVLREEVRRLANLILIGLAESRADRRAKASQAGRQSPPPELQHVSWAYERAGSRVMPNPYFDPRVPDIADRRRSISGLVASPNMKIQTFRWSMNHEFAVYLDNSRNSPPHQVITYALDGQFTPYTDKDRFAFMDDPFTLQQPRGLLAPPPRTQHQLERAWWTGIAEISVKPADRQDSLLQWQASEPSTPNRESSYTRSSAFTIGFAASPEGAGLEGGYSYSDSETYSIPDWGVSNKTSGNHARWEFSSRNPCDIRPATYSTERCFNRAFLQDGTPRRPNPQSLEQLQMHVNARWRTTRLLTPADGKVEFEIRTPITMADTYCYRWSAVLGACDADSWGLTRYQLGGKPDEVMQVLLDVPAVVPVGVRSVTFDKPRADGSVNETVRGTVTLKAPARIDTSVVLHSDSRNAVIGTPTATGSTTVVEVPEGAQRVSFDIRTNDNGLPDGRDTTAQISAFYGDLVIGQLRIGRPAADG